MKELSGKWVYINFVGGRSMASKCYDVDMPLIKIDGWAPDKRPEWVNVSRIESIREERASRGE
jgi:hypothetical protein